MQETQIWCTEKLRFRKNANNSSKIYEIREFIKDKQKSFYENALNTILA